MQSVGGILSYRHEEEAEGVVAAVFRDIRRRLPIVPALFKALAADPEALVEAWLQARCLYDHPGRAEAAARLRAAGRPELPYAPGREVRAAVGPFADELPALLLVVSSLALTLDGALPRRPPPPLDLPEPGPVPEPEVPDRGEHALFAQIRAVYGSEHVPSMFRSLAARGLLEEPWAAIGPYLAGEAGREHARRLAVEAEAQARRFPEAACFSVERARPILDLFRRALPRNLIFAAACAASRVASSTAPAR